MILLRKGIKFKYELVKMQRIFTTPTECEVHNMSKVFELLKEYGVFYVATVKNGMPAVRPFGAVMEYNDELYIATANFKDVYKQLITEKNVQLAATKAGTLDWLRISGIAEEVREISIKEKMLQECPVLVNIFKSADNEVFAVFCIKDMHAVSYAAGSCKELQ